MRNEFYKVTCNVDILGGDVDLIFSAKWLESLPLSISLPHKELKQIINTKKKKDKERKQINSFHNSTLESPDKRSKKTTKTLISSLFSQNHRVMDCVKFNKKTATKRQNFAKKLKLCFNCLSRAHMLKERQSEFRCRVDGCRQKPYPST